MSLFFQAGIIDQIINNEELEIDTILLNINQSEFHVNKSEDKFDIKKLNYFYNKNTWIKKHINSLDHKEKYKFFIPIYRWNSLVPSLFGNKFFKKSYTKDGYSPNPPKIMDSVNVSWQLKKNRMENNDRVFSLDTNFLNLINHVNHLCNENNIKLICYISPTFNAKNFKPQFNSKIKNFFLSKSISLLDYSNLFNENKKIQNIWNWSDIFHLNSKGAKIFSEIVLQDLKGHN